MAWLQSDITREEAEALLEPLENGKFNVRVRTAGGHVLCVAYRGKPTHHLIAEGEDGMLKVNKKSYGLDTSDLHKLIAHLANPPAGSGWPVPLQLNDSGTPQPTSTGGGQPSGSLNRQDSTAQGKKPKWLHSAMDKPEAERLLNIDNAMVDGRFIVRARGPDYPKDFVLSVVYRGKATHHLITPGSDGFMTINRKTFGDPVMTMKELVMKFVYEDLPAGWPIRLIEYVTESEAVSPLKLRRTHSQRSNSATAEAGRPPMARADSTTSRNSVPPTSAGAASSAESTEWLHPMMTNDEARDLINGNDDGFFIVRRYNAPELFVISVVYRGKPTHHLVNAPNDAISTVNKKPTGVTGIVNTIALLRNKQPFWPVPLGNFIPFVAGASPRVESEATSSNENDAEERRRADAEAAAQRERQAELKRQEEETKARNQEAEAQRHAEEKERRQREDEERRRQDEEKEREERRQSEERAKLAAEEAQKRREQEEADENAITGFFELDDPFPEGDEEDYDAGYVHVAPDATTLVQAARDLARRSQGGISPEAPLRLSVGKILKLDVGGESSTEDGGPGVETENPYASIPRSSIDNARVNALESQIKSMAAREAESMARITILEEATENMVEALSLVPETAALRKKCAELEKKLALIEHILLARGPENAMVEIEVRMIKKEAYGPRMSAPKVSDLSRSTVVGKTRVLKGSTFATVRKAITEEFDENHFPASFKFYGVNENADNLVVIHERQETKTPVEDGVVYIYDSSEKKQEQTRSVRLSNGRADKSWVKQNN